MIEKITLETKAGDEIDLTPWIEQMRENHKRKRGLTEQTPIGSTADGDYFWWDEDTNPPLKKASVTRVLRKIKAGK